MYRGALPMLHGRARGKGVYGFGHPMPKGANARVVHGTLAHALRHLCDEASAPQTLRLPRALTLTSASTGLQLVLL